MNASNDYDEYLLELREQVCRRCIEHQEGSPPCGPQGKRCGIEEHVPELVSICRTTESVLMDPYVEKLHREICAACAFRDEPACPCPLEYLLQLAVEAVENVERRRAARAVGRPNGREPALAAALNHSGSLTYDI